MNKVTQIERAKQFQKMHINDEIIVLPNAWDTGSAVIFEKAGSKAIGTTSAGVAYSLGYSDGEILPFNLLLDFIERTSARIKVPLTVDIEEGFGSDLVEIGENIHQVINRGAVGINIEDHFDELTMELRNLDDHLNIISNVAKIKQKTGIPFVLNARINTHWYDLSDKTNLLQQAINRGNACLDAGADCVFVPGISEAADIILLATSLKGPLNILASANCPQVKNLHAMGVARVSLGSSPARACLGLTRKIINEFSQQGSYTSMYENDLPYKEANSIFSSSD